MQRISLRKLYFFSIIVFFVFYSSCKKEPISILTGCCGNPGINEQVGNGHLFVPNIFTPNFNDTNDKFYLLGDSMNVSSLQIFNAKGELVFENSNFPVGYYTSGWDGTVNGIVEPGLYSVKVTVTADNGVTKQFTSEVCNYPCDLLNSDPKPINKEGCQFPSQSDNGEFNPNLASGESDDC